jgi:hypothetical protein
VPFPGIDSIVTAAKDYIQFFFTKYVDKPETRVHVFETFLDFQGFRNTWTKRALDTFDFATTSGKYNNVTVRSDPQLYSDGNAYNDDDLTHVVEPEPEHTIPPAADEPEPPSPRVTLREITRDTPPARIGWTLTNWRVLQRILADQIAEIGNYDVISGAPF